jgi:hypothetical protein
LYSYNGIWPLGAGFGGFACGASVWFVVLVVLAFPCFLIGLLALPLCGAAPTFLCRRKEK